MHDGDSSSSGPPPARNAAGQFRRPGHYIKRAYHKIRVGSSTQFGLALFIPQFAAISENSSRVLIRSYFDGAELPAIYQPLADRPIQIFFRCPGASLSEVRVIATTFGSVTPGKIDFKLFRLGEIAPLRETELSLDHRSDGITSAFQFDPIADSTGGWFEARLTLAAPPNSQRISIHGRIVAKNHPLYRSLEKNPAGGSVSYVQGTDEKVDRLFHPSAETKQFVPRYYGFSSQIRTGAASRTWTQFGWEGLKLKAVPQPLLRAIPITASFVCPVDRLDELQIFLATFDRINSCTIVVSLFERAAGDNGRRLLHQATIPGWKVVNNVPHRFRFEPLQNVSGTLFDLEIVSADCSAGNTIGIWGSIVEPESLTAESIAAGSLLIDLKPTEIFGPDRSDPERTPRSELLQQIKSVLLLVELEAWTNQPPALAALIKKLSATGIGIVPVFAANSEYAVQELRKFDAVILYQLPLSGSVAEIIRLARRLGRIVLALPELKSQPAAADPLPQLEESDRKRIALRQAGIKKTISNCDFILKLGELSEADRCGRTVIDLESDNGSTALRLAAAVYQTIHLPPVSIITGSNTDETQRLIAGQTYQGRIEVIKIGAPIGDQKSAGAVYPSFNQAVARSAGAILLFIGEKAALAGDLITRHVEAIVLGGWDLVCEVQPGCPESSALYSVFTQSDTFSVRREAVGAGCFDPSFDTSDGTTKKLLDEFARIDFGFRLYRAGARIGTTSIPAAAAETKPQNISNLPAAPANADALRRLLALNPELPVIARRWFEGVAAESGLDTEKIDGLASSRKIRMVKHRLKILTYRWHVAHQYELYKLPHDFTLITDLGTGFTENWNFRERPLPASARLEKLARIDPADYDLAILHFDENVLAPENCNRVLAGDWGDSFRHLRERFPLPMIAVCHGTPQFFGQYDSKYQQPNLGEIIEKERQRLVEYLANILVITNSGQAQQEWKFRRSQTIWHGIDPTQFPETTYSGGILTLGQAMAERPHYRGYFLAEKVLQSLPPDLHAESLQVEEPPVDFRQDGNEFAEIRFRNYVDAIRRYSIYFNPTIRSPMPRSRVEAMICGLATVSADNHDVSAFIENGVNGFRSNNPEELRDYLTLLGRNPKEARRIGQAGRKTACDLFNHDRYLESWQTAIESL